MNADSEQPPSEAPIPDADRLVERNLMRRNPALQIWLIAAVFYAILVGMFLFVLVLIIRG